MSEIEPGLESVPTPERPPVAIREGLPPAYRMRADAHYVEQLDAASSPSVRLIDARTIEVRGDDPRPAASFVESIKRHGVLQPILVQTRGGRYRLIAGRKRLAAAISAGLREVPCLVQRVDEEQAGRAGRGHQPAGAGSARPCLVQRVDEEQAASCRATDLRAHEAAAAVRQAPVPVERGTGATDQLAQSLLALASSANLLSGGSPLTVAVAADLVRAEAARALQLLLASRVLRDEVPVSRLKVPVRAVIDRAMQMTQAERRLRATEVHVLADGVRDAAVRGDEELLASALAGLVMATVSLVGEKGGRPRSPRRSRRPRHVRRAQESLSVLPSRRSRCRCPKAGWSARSTPHGRWPTPRPARWR